VLQRQAAGQRGDQEGPGKGSVGIGQKLQDLAGQATKGPGGAGGNEVGSPSDALPAAATFCLLQQQQQCRPVFLDMP
jgi:hypothetical protein